MSKFVSLLAVLSVLSCLPQYGQLKQHKQSDSNQPYVVERIVYDSNNNTKNYYLFPDIKAYLESLNTPSTQSSTASTTQSTAVSSSASTTVSPSPSTTESSSASTSPSPSSSTTESSIASTTVSSNASTTVSPSPSTQSSTASTTVSSTLSTTVSSSASTTESTTEQLCTSTPDPTTSLTTTVQPLTKPTDAIRVTSQPGTKPLGISDKNCYKVLQPSRDVKPTPVASSLFMLICSDVYAEHGWTAVQRRMKGSVSFERTWADYRDGFGDEDGDFWIGLNRLNKLTTKQDQQLLIVMLDSAQNFYYALYDLFQVGKESDLFPLQNVGCYSGTAGDSLIESVGKPFSTPDRNYDTKLQRHCAKDFGGGWWYYGTLCSQSNLNGVFDARNSVKAITWDSISPSMSLVYTEMFIRPSCEKDITPKMIIKDIIYV